MDRYHATKAMRSEAIDNAWRWAVVDRNTIKYAIVAWCSHEAHANRIVAALNRQP